MVEEHSDHPGHDDDSTMVALAHARGGVDRNVGHHLHPSLGQLPPPAVRMAIPRLLRLGP
jgi:hypothetical protein